MPILLKCPRLLTDKKNANDKKAKWESEREIFFGILCARIGKVSTFAAPNWKGKEVKEHLKIREKCQSIA